MVRGVTVVLVAVAVILSVTSIVLAKVGFWTGNDYRNKLTTAAQQAYTAGVIDAYLYQTAAVASTGGPAGVMNRCLRRKYPNITVGQAHAIVAKYLQANPEKWGEDMPALVVFAVCE